MARKRVTSLRISDYTAAQIVQLGDKLQSSQSEIILLAIDRMYRQEFGRGTNPLHQEDAQPSDDTSSR